MFKFFFIYVISYKVYVYEIFCLLVVEFVGGISGICMLIYFDGFWKLKKVVDF